MKKDGQKTVLVLDNIRSVYNVGAIFRTADALAIDRIYLVGITPAPVDRFGRFRKDLAKAALGAEKSVTWESVTSLTSIFKKLKATGYQLIAIEQGFRSVDYKIVQTKNRVAFVVGEETKGISKKFLKLCDLVAEIPMRGQKESLNVSVATGVALFRILNQ